MDLRTVVYQDLSFAVQPESIKFEFQIGCIKSRSIYISNLKTQAQKVQIKPPVNGYFNVDCGSESVLLPGIKLPITVTFVATELDSYSDEITIDCCGTKSITVHLEAVPKRPRTNIPRYIHWGTLPLGHSVSHSVAIHPEPGDIPTVFMVRSLLDGTDLRISPSSGILSPGDPPTMLVITVTPTTYTSMAHDVLIFIHPDPGKFSPYDLSVTWDCKPGVIRDNLLAKITPIKSPKKHLTDSPKVVKVKVDDCSKPIVKSYYDAILNLQVPINTPHAISTIVRHEEAKERSVFDQLGPLGRYLEQDNEIYAFMQKEFKARGKCYERKTDALATETSSGLPSLINPEVEFSYLTLLEPDVVDQLYKQDVPTYARQRTVRDSIDEEDDMEWPTVQSKKTEWFVRYRILSKFVRAARDTVVAKRMAKVLDVMRNQVLTREELEPLNAQGIVNDVLQEQGTNVVTNVETKQTTNTNKDQKTKKRTR